MKKSSLIAITFIFIFSCKENVDFQSANHYQNVVKFNSIEHINLVSDKIAKMTEQEFSSWEKENSFISYRSVLTQARNEWEAVATIEGKTDFLSKYQDILTLKDSTLIPSIDIPLYQSIVNREGIYETTGYLNKVVGDFIVSVKKADYHKLKTANIVINSPSGKMVENDGVRIVKFTGFDSNPKARTNSTCSTLMKASYFDNHSGCRDDREVFLTLRSYFMLSTSYEGDSRQPRVFLEVAGTYRNGWCNWFSYKTQLEYRNVSFTIMAWINQNSVGVPTLFTKTLPDTSTAIDQVSLVWDGKIGDALLNQSITANPFTSLHAEGKSRGVGNNWAVIDCQ